MFNFSEGKSPKNWLKYLEFWLNIYKRQLTSGCLHGTFYKIYYRKAYYIASVQKTSCRNTGHFTSTTAIFRIFAKYINFTLSLSKGKSKIQDLKSHKLRNELRFR